MKKETWVLKIAVILIMLPVLAIVIFGFPAIIREASESSTQMVIVLYGILAALSLSMFPFSAALYQAYKLLNYIDHDEAFSDKSVDTLRKIKRYAFSIAAVHLLSFPFYFIVGEVDDAPGVILVGLIFVSAPAVIAVFAAVLEKLLDNALDLKKDNELTV
ncbi:Protein of unknown function [Alkalibacterium subtropicum]|uniref:DUF2975 domain-containing protein n=1 Tax=Alkalibacterium subtropicum TaxID=753702 RepID=A0A1I1HK69_9LACT|nr:DUF2975 domain-containing protein [Alkalibacterium subtropicum]SFC22348.1 Protein of unknown function [Alkalibacterium subtropicum]